MSEQKKKVFPKWLKIAIFVAFNLAVILIAAISEHKEAESAVKIAEIDIRWELLLPALGCFVMAVAAEIAKYSLLLKNSTGHWHWRVARRTVLIGRYYDNITPAAIGGQPFQIYYMNKNGIAPAQSAAVPIAGFMSMQLSFILIALTVFIFSPPSAESGVLRITCYIGLLFFAFFPALILGSMFFPKAIAAVLGWFMRLVQRFGRRNKEENEAKVRKLEQTVHEYSDCLRTLLSKPLLCVCVMLLGLIYEFGLLTIPYFVVLAFGGEIAFWRCFATTVLLSSAIAFIPTPGNAGAAEGSFYVVFSMLTSGYTFWAMLVWRFFNYYAFILMGLGIHLEMHIARKRNRADVIDWHDAEREVENQNKA